jgi:hypothetical protein
VNLGDRLDVRLSDRAETRAPEGRAWSVVLATEEARFGGDDASRLTPAATAALRSAGAMVLRA